MVENTAKKSSPVMITLAWAVVIIPLGWGFNYTLQNAFKLFTASAPATTSPAK